MKVCYACKMSKPLEEFGVAKSRPDGRQSACKVCRRRQGKAWYAENTALQKRRAKASRQALRGKLREQVQGWKRSHPCVTCGEADPLLLDFDHRPGTVKEFNIGNAVSLCVSLSRLAAEIEKCDILCSHCHRRATAARLGRT